MSITLTNLFTDPLNLTGWDSAPKEWIKTEYEIAGYGGGKVLELKGTQESREKSIKTTYTIPLFSTHQYYVRWYGYQELKNSEETIGYYWPSAEPSIVEGMSLKEELTWQMYSIVTNREGHVDQQAIFRFDFNNKYTSNTFWFSAPMLIDLTVSFGAGIEPNKEWCDIHIPFFQGTKILNNFELGLVNVTPIMTSPTTPEGYIVTAKSEVSEPRAGWNAFDGYSNTDQEEHRWHSAKDDFPQWLSIQFPQERAVTAFSIKNCNDVHLGIQNFQLQGSNNNIDWDVLGNYIGISTLGAETLYTIANPSLYRYYRLYITSSYHTTDQKTYYCIIDKFTLFTSGCSLVKKEGESYIEPKEVYVKNENKWKLALECFGKKEDQWSN